MAYKDLSDDLGKKSEYISRIGCKPDALLLCRQCRRKGPRRGYVKC